MKPVVIQPGDNDAILWYVEWTLQCWIAGLAMAGVSGKYEAKVVRDEEPGKENLQVSVKLGLPISDTVIGRSEHLFQFNLYGLYHEPENFTVALSKVLVEALSRMATNVSKKLQDIENMQYGNIEMFTHEDWN